MTNIADLSNAEYDRWLDELDETLPPVLPPREKMIERLAAAVTYAHFNFVKRDADGAYRVPSRKDQRILHRVTDQGCDCDDFRYKHICAHWLAVGSQSNGTFLIARILRSRNLTELNRQLELWFEPCRDTDPALIERYNLSRRCPPELLAFARMEFKRRRAEFTGRPLKSVKPETPRDAMQRLLSAGLIAAEGQPSATRRAPGQRAKALERAARWNLAVRQQRAQEGRA